MFTGPGKDTRFRLSETQSKALAEAYGTPLYVVDETLFRVRIREYKAAFASAYPDSEITYAAKANSTLAVLKIAYDEGCTIDVASEGELRAALLAGVPAGACHLHGNNKQRHELEFAISQGVAHIVVDNFSEIDTIQEILKTQPNENPRLVLRLAPGVDPKTHAKISTGQADTKFGFNIADGSAEEAVKACLEKKLNLYGVHCHVGSQLVDPEAQRSGGELITAFAAKMKSIQDWSARYINVGGGLGVRYTQEDKPMGLEDYCRLVVFSVQSALDGSELKPKLAQEPGRSLIAEAGVTLYTVGVRKTVPIGPGQTRTYLCVDGGLSDNPRPALYGAVYDVELAARSDFDWEYQTDGPGAASVEPLGDATYTINGKHCETDRLFPNVTLPASVKQGDLIQVLVTGAYNASMASNYNRYQRPAMAIIKCDGTHALIARRDTWEEMFAREIIGTQSPQSTEIREIN